MTSSDPNSDIRRHFSHFFAGHPCRELVWPLGPAHQKYPRLRVLEFAPGPKTALWIYATVGTWETCGDPRLEFIITAPGQDLRHVELLFMAAWYQGQYGLGSGHTLPIGEPWLPGSGCEYFLVSLPYPFGPDLEICEFEGGHLHALWLLPITVEEREFKVRAGLEALEQKFDERALEYWSPDRSSVV